MKTELVFIILLISIFMVWGTDVATADVKVKNLTCEYLRSPMGLDVKEPRISWMLESLNKAEKQTAYQVLVASSEDSLRSDKGDLWDSGKVESDQSIHVAYRGGSLASGMRCFWKARVWDKNGHLSSWSDVSSWTMGLMDPDDWHAKWIGADESLGKQSQIGNAHWIWFPEGNPKKEAPAGTRWFRKTFDIGLSRHPKSAALMITADNSAVVYVNGKQIGETNKWESAFEFDITDHLAAGRNVLAVAAKNDAPTPAGLIAKLDIDFQAGAPITLITDNTWRTANAEFTGWTAAEFDDSAWRESMDLGSADSQPWGIPHLLLVQKNPSPLLRKAFNISNPIKHAVAYTCGLGFFELRINGRKVDDTILQPGFTRYDKRALYVTTDVTTLLRQGANAVGVMLGNGWFNSAARDAWDFDRTPWRDTPRLLMQLEIEYMDGSRQMVVTDDTWKTAPGPIVFDGIRNGESYDAGLEKPGWDTPGYSDSDWKPVLLVKAPTSRLVSQKTLPVRIVKTITPVKVTEPKPGIFVFDMGQNIAGWGRLTVSGPAGTKISIKYDERLSPDGLLDQQNASLVYSGKFQTDTYTLKGGGVEVWEPRFVYHGFQYAQVEGFPGKPGPDNLKACVVHTDFEQIGSFECSNDLLNRIQKNAQWSYVGNFVTGYPTDCPHREKNGWTGDAHLAAEMGLMNFNPMANYTKWMDDFDDVQKDEGDFPGIVPTGSWGYGIGPAWDSAYLLIPDYLRLYCGDTRVLENHYEGFKRYIDYLTGKAENGIVSYGLGDWCPPVGGAQGHKAPAALTSTAYYYVDTLITAHVASMLGKKDDAAKYTELAESIKKAFNAKFYDASRGAYTGDCQTSQATALYQGLAAPQEKDKIMQFLLTEIDNAKGHLDCGILGTKYLLHVLTDNGKSDTAYTIATQRDFPSWGHWLEQGATTLWENWDGSASRNHIMFGDISTWFYSAIAGINPDPDNPGFKHIIIRPRIMGDLKWARAEHKSMYGTIRSAWAIKGSDLDMEIEVPVNTTADVYVPAASVDDVKAGGKPASGAMGVEFRRMQDGCAVFSVGSGHYQFAARH